jgi:hypothetical protein
LLEDSLDHARTDAELPADLEHAIAGGLPFMYLRFHSTPTWFRSVRPGASANWRPFSAWSSGRMATLYTKSANRGRLAAGAIGKLDRAETENRISIPAPTAEVRAENRKS